MDVHARTRCNISEELDFKFRAALGLCFDHEMECLAGQLAIGG